MNRYRLSKYNPAYRDADGSYTKEEWTSISDIGKTFEGVTLQLEDYMHVEDAYIASFQLIMDECHVSSLQVTYLEKRGYPLSHVDERFIHPEDLYPCKMRDFYKKVKVGTVLTGWRIEYMIRLMLRENVYAHLVYKDTLHPNKAFKVFVGYDYLASVHTPNNLYALNGALSSNRMYLE